MTCSTALTVPEIADCEDVVIGRAKEAFANRKWKRFQDETRALDSEDCRAMQHIWKGRSELLVSPEGLLLCGQWLVIPRCLQSQVVELAHQGHQGTAKTKARLRSKVWFPRIDAMVDKLVRRCHPCTITARDPAPVVTETPSTQPCSQISLDFGSFPDGWLTAVMIDSCTRFPVVELVVSTAFEHDSPVLEKTFALLGLPDEV
ncbi:hypothetical protein NDU88_003796 [Pleurodeles waltl]|uniref:Gypsy retrotransposon integrase-like protein 1 n=1 Tax=Pleurodeles waltl TaxID=8319 RepID=A0AAV7SGY4_PLEWA|nr:hypothetical protein NDU88_003796 [Pleurodeles waltl]